MEELNKLAAEIVENLVSCDSAEPEAVEQHEVWTRQRLEKALRALEQRAEAAEAKLAELEKQEPAGYAVKRFDNGKFGSWLQSKGMAKGNADYCVVPLFERPLPSTEWEILIPKKLPMDIPFAAHRIRNGGWNDCINTILRNIEEAK